MSYCPKCGKEVPSDAMFCPYCGSSLEILTAQRKQVKEKEKKEIIEKASTGRRFASYIIDIIILIAIEGFICSPFMLHITGANYFYIFIGDNYLEILCTCVIIEAIYYIYLFGKKGQTLGMMAMKIKLIRTNGTRVDYTDGFLRYMGMIISGLIFDIGYLWIVIDKDKQGWHDKIADTYVVPV